MCHTSGHPTHPGLHRLERCLGSPSAPDRVRVPAAVSRVDSRATLMRATRCRRWDTLVHPSACETYCLLLEVPFVTEIRFYCCSLGIGNDTVVNKQFS